jgi:hypothetical protein
LLERIEKGATVNLEVKWGLITLIKQTVDLCDELKNVDLECPLEKGEMVLTKEVDLPKQIPPVRCFFFFFKIVSEKTKQLTSFLQGKYSVLADVYNKEQNQVTCLKADDIVFHF